MKDDVPKKKKSARVTRLDLLTPLRDAKGD